MPLKIDVLGHRYDDSEPAFTAVASGQFYYHLKLKKLFERESFNQRLEDNGLAFADGEIGIPSDDYIARHEDMLRNLYDVAEPGAPTLNSAPGAAGIIELSWTPGTGPIAGWRLMRSVTTLEDWELVVELPENYRGYHDEGLTPGTYDYELFAFNAVGDSVPGTTTATATA